ncbi:hypothetical protein KL921_001141 [Ogataea angusta]|uniref:Aminotransferase class I/classII large domain-containing protein n=1 Tax=Pichia angusta TaxID=870730 RepID=A0AAN6DJY1_PICAN|nr:uncharacterized protein KL928_001307 [Ogataea angusta]KAG7813595.1 hypothetical protein KL921_001141 [Ogataea angusta]KAG7821223.1 hypothetical protein KL928_001307 [Ogataea angusta]KAG7826075.1 hypothetical protein KL909_000127 [Ogataea angusta]KAG7832179.1 hypothetical protein KL920_000514 [Ogataea angusta]KAG7836351.1 hypothetical protein KL943_002000 [Ogataea angusta]
MTVDWSKYLSHEATLREPSVMKMMGRFGRIISLGAGLPHPDCFPLKSVSFDFLSPKTGFSTTEKVEVPDNELLYEALQYTSGRGTSYFDEFSKKHIETYHKPLYNDWDIVVTAGATQSLDAVLRLLCDPNEDTILSEEFTYPAFLETCSPMRLKVFPVKVDEHGVCPKDLDKLLVDWSGPHKKPKLIYTMPVGQNPLGITMSLERRGEFYEVCKKHDLIIVEDDPYYHLQLDYEEKLPSLLKFDTDGRVIRFDSFSKIMTPGARCSIVTANKVFVDKLVVHNEVSIHSSAAPSQLILHELLKTWEAQGFAKWVEHLGQHYKKRRALLNSAFERFLPKELCSWNLPDSGMFLWIEINQEAFAKPENIPANQWATELENMIFDANIDKGVLLAKGHWFMVDQTLQKAGFRATYAFAEEEELVEASQRFGEALKSIHAKLANNLI